METRITEVIEKYINDKLVLAVASNPVNPLECAKLKIKRVVIKGETFYQATRTVGTKELHTNYNAEGARAALAEALQAGFRQLELKNDESSAVVMISKKGTVTVKEHRVKPEQEKPVLQRGIKADISVSEEGLEKALLHANNRVKNYVLTEGTPIDFLVELKVMTKSGKVVAAKYDKFRQINRYLEFVSDIVSSLPRDREVSIIDFGCGKSYLTFALYYYLHELKGYAVKITGLDLKADVIENCNALAKKLNYTGLSFLHGDIADYTGTDSVDMVVTLHACDTATDYALYKAIKWNAKVIFCVPCCQHELNKQIANEKLKDVFKYGLIKERMAALFTDSFRACMLEEQGYKTQILEFIDMEHTPKNILIRAVKKPMETGTKGKASLSCEELMKELNVKPTLYKLLHPDQK